MCFSPAFIDRAWWNTTSGEKGADLIRGAFRQVGLEPLDRNFVETTRHLHPLSVIVDDGLESEKFDGGGDSGGGGTTATEGIVQLMAKGLDGEVTIAAYAVAMLDISNLHGLAVGANLVVVNITHVLDLAPFGGDIKLICPDPIERWSTLSQAWHGSSGNGFMTLWEKVMVTDCGHTPVSGSSTESRPDASAPAKLKKKRSLPSFFGVAGCTQDNISAITNHPRFHEASRAFMDVLGADLSDTSSIPADLKGKSGAEVIEHVVSFGGKLAAQVHEVFPQLKPSKRSLKRKNEAEDEKPSSRRSRYAVAIGETTSQAKILNSQHRLQALREIQVEDAARGEAMIVHSSARYDLLTPVVMALKSAGIFSVDDAMSGKAPTIKDFQRFIHAGGRIRENAFVLYKNRHGLQGMSTAYNYYFDFVYGGAEKHPTLLNPTAPPLCPIIGDKQQVHKAPKCIEGASSARGNRVGSSSGSMHSRDTITQTLNI